MKNYIFLVSLMFVILTSGCKKDEKTNDPPPTATVTDIDGNVYNTVTIGTQVWMVENLKTTRFNDGSAIQLVSDDTVWSNLTSPGYCWYDNDEATNKDPFGALYNWYTVNSGKLCPAGWHLPTDDEWDIIVNYLDGDTIAGGKMKETGTTLWNSPNTGATNSSGFTGLPGGFCNFNGNFYSIGFNGSWWSTTEYVT